MYKDSSDVGAIVVFLLKVLLICVPVFLIGFIHLPLSGSHVGYVTAVDDGWLCTNVYIKTKRESSQEDLYAIPKESEVKEELITVLKSKENVEIVYKNNNWSLCGREITEVNLLNNK